MQRVSRAGRASGDPSRVAPAHIEQRVDQGPKHRLSKAALRPRIDHHDTSIVDDSVRAAKQGRCAEAVDAAERGLKRTSLAGPLRHSLIEVAGTCACRLKDEPKARHYFSLASPEFEDNLVRACTSVDIKLLE